MADLKTVGFLQYTRGTYMRKWEADYLSQKTGGRAIHIVKDISTGQKLLDNATTDINLLNATIMVKNISSTNHVEIGGATNKPIKIMPWRFALWTNGLSTADTVVTTTGGTVKLEIYVVEE